jgi:hypothetical protein
MRQFYAAIRGSKGVNRVEELREQIGNSRGCVAGEIIEMDGVEDVIIRLCYTNELPKGTRFIFIVASVRAIYSL